MWCLLCDNFLFQLFKLSNVQLQHEIPAVLLNTNLLYLMLYQALITTFVVVVLFFWHVESNSIEES